MPHAVGTLYYGDNLPIMKKYIKSESVDLVYLDPPFNSNVNYNVIFRDESKPGGGGRRLGHLMTRGRGGTRPRRSTTG